LNSFKENKRGDFIKNIMDELPGDITRINPSYGTPTVFCYEFINNYESRG